MKKILLAGLLLPVFAIANTGNSYNTIKKIYKKQSTNYVLILNLNQCKGYENSPFDLSQIGFQPDKKIKKANIGFTLREKSGTKKILINFTSPNGNNQNYNAKVLIKDGKLKIKNTYQCKSKDSSINIYRTGTPL